MGGVGAAAAVTGLATAGVSLGSRASASASPNSGGNTGRRVAVFGAGPAGMCVAQELAERGFTVDVYEKYSRLGGMVRAFVTSGGGTGGRPSIPETSGLHTLLPGYTALPDIMRRIPDGSGGTVFDRVTNIVDLPNIPARMNMFRNKSIIIGFPLGTNNSQLGVHIPLNGASREFTPDVFIPWITESLTALGGFWPSDIPHLASKFAAWSSSGPNRKSGQLDNIELVYGFFRAELLSPSARAFLRTFAQGASVDSPETGINAGVYRDAILDPMINMLNGRRSFVGVGIVDGPETEVWFDPQAKYLAGLGTTFHMNNTLTEVGVEGGRIVGATVIDDGGGRKAVDADWYVLAMPADHLQKLLNPDLVRADPNLANIQKLRSSVESGLQLLFRDSMGVAGGASANDDTWLTFGAMMSDIWGNGFDLRNYGDGQAGALLSVEFNHHTFTDTPGILHGRPLRLLDQRQTIEEVRANIIRSWPGGKELFAEGNFLGYSPHPTLKWRDGQGWEVPDLRTASGPGESQYFPDQVGRIPNLFLVGGHTKTPLLGDCMESAAVSAKFATTGILAASGVNEHPVGGMEFMGAPPELAGVRADDDRRYAAGLPNIFDVIAPAHMP